MSIDTDPLARFQALLERAGTDAPFDHTAMALATVNQAGQPSVRMVLLHGFDPRGFVFYTNYESRKARELETTRRAALCFYWPWIEEQARIEGEVARIGEAESDAYFATRPRGKQVGAWASLQSQPLDSRATLEARVAEIEARFAGREVPRPPNWGGYRLAPERIEFWRAGEHRLHDRFLYTRDAAGTWTMTRLYP
ncbi:MAG TPA: pyridoxamine 5'-phosphate oxidase [Vicinamibacterales bacterium]